MTDKVCPVCGYKPDKKDIEETKYQLLKCSCGQRCCDLCLTYEYKDGYIDDVKCPECSDIKPLGMDRKELLEEEYDGNIRS